MGKRLSDREIEQIRRRYDEFSMVPGPAYRAFMFNAHHDMGKLLETIDYLVSIEKHYRAEQA